MEFAFLSISLSLYPNLVAFVTRGGAEYGTMDKEEPRADGQGFFVIFREACYRAGGFSKREKVVDRRIRCEMERFAGEAVGLEGWERRERGWKAAPAAGLTCFSVAPETATEETKPRRQNKVQRLDYGD